MEGRKRLCPTGRGPRCHFCDPHNFTHREIKVKRSLFSDSWWLSGFWLEGMSPDLKASGVFCVFAKLGWRRGRWKHKGPGTRSPAHPIRQAGAPSRQLLSAGLLLSFAPLRLQLIIL